MVLFKRLVRYFFAFIIISVILTELILRVIFYFGFVPMGLQTVDSAFHNTETIEFRGEVLPDIHASGTKVARRGYPYVINEYSGFREGFDFSKKAIRFLTIGASYVNGCCLVDQDEFLFNNLSARKLAENLGVGVQFADSSWNNNARFFNNYIIYGSKVLEKGFKHDYAIIEVSYEALAHPEHERPMTIEEYQNDKELPEDRQSISKMIKRSFLSDLYFVRFSFTIAGIFKWYKPRLEQLVPFNKAERIKQDEWKKKLYRSDRPYYDDKKLSNLEPTKIRKAYEENKLIMKDSFIYWIGDLKRLVDLTKEAGATPIVMIFPEFREPDLIVLLDQLKEHEVKWVYLNSIRNYSDEKLWWKAHPTFPASQKLWADEFVDKIMQLERENLELLAKSLR